MTKYDAVCSEANGCDRHPFEAAGLLARVTFGWANALLRQGHQRQLGPDDIWPLDPECTCKEISVVFESAFKRCKSIVKTMAVLYGWQMLFIGILQASALSCTLYGPVVLKAVLTQIEDGNHFDVKLVLQYVVSLFFVQVVQAIMTAHVNLKNQTLTIKITSGLQHLLFQKALILNAKCRREKTTGEIANMFSTDIQWIISFALFTNQIWLVPAQLIVLLAMLYSIIGWAAFVGAAVIALTLISNNVLVSAQRRAYKLLMEQKDKRMRAINEVFGAMQIIKLNAWEEKFGDKIEVLRKAELSTLARLVTINSMQVGFLFSAPVLVTVTSFAIYSMVMQQSLTAAKVFTALSLFTLLRRPMMYLPRMVASLMQAVVALKRIAEFLNMEDKDPNIVMTQDNMPLQQLNAYHESGVAVQIVNGTFTWDFNLKPLFDCIDLTIKRGEFVVIHGAVGEGKSSLCSLLLGEMYKLNGSVFVGGQIAYFSQQAWIQNMTIRDNILFGKPYDRKKYNKVIEACALTKDLSSFAAGDRTEIGQKGVNLSGGQKARISLARACYSDADVFILDSPLSAVDAIVQNEIFTKCFLSLLRNKTILLVTHSPDIIASSFIDRTIKIKEGQLISTLMARQEYEALVSPLIAHCALKYNNHLEMTPIVDQDSKMKTQIRNAGMVLSPTIPTDIVGASPFNEANIQSYEEEEKGKLIFDEARSHGRVATKIFSAYLSAIGGWPNVLCWVLLLSLWQALAISSDFWLSKWSATANVVTKQVFLEQAKYYLGVYAALSFGGVIFTFLRTLSVLMSGLRASRILFDDMTKSLLRAPMNFFDTNPLGRILNRYSGDVTTVDTQIADILNSMLTMASMAAFSLGTTIVIIRLYGLLVIPLLFIYWYVGHIYVQPAREIERLNKTTKSPMLNLISECIDGALVIRAFGQNQVRRFQRLHHHNVDNNLAAIYVNSVFGQWFSMRIQLTSALILLVIAISLVFSKDFISPGVIGLILNYAFSILPFFEWIVQCWSTIETSMISPERLAEYAAIKSEAPRFIPGATAYDWPTTGQITFTNMSFRYKENDPLVLQNVNLDIESGEKIGIVGRTGAGKSSLTMALFRISELAAGTITIDGIDVSRIGIKTLRSNIAIIPQVPVLFKGTLRNYLDPFGEYSDAYLWEALRKVRLEERIAHVDGQLDSAVEENGENFSVGERQMLCMSRALLRQTRIVVLDEATAAIDHETDQNLQQVIRTEFASSTVLTIAHRLDTVLDYDRIVVFDQGRIVQCGSPQELINAGEGIFFELCSEGGFLHKLNST